MTIKELRLKKGWTQEDLARHSGLSARTIQRAESEKSISSESMKCLAAVFEISIHSLKREQNMDNSNHTDTAHINIGQLENSALKFATSLFKTPKENAPDPLNKIERNALNYGKSLFNKLKQ